MSGTESDGDRAASRRRAAPGRRQPQPRQPLPPPEMPQPPPRYRWMRPRMQGFSGQINLYIRDDVLSTIPEVLTRVGGDALYQRFRDGPFGYLIQIRRYESANNALHELLARELEDDNFSEFERMFHVAGRDILFRAQEYALVTGLFFGPSSFDPKVRHEIPKTSLFYTKYNGQKTLSNQLKKDFNDPDHRLGSPEQYLQAANLLMYYFMLLARDNPPIDEWAWALVENYEEWYRFPWGSWSFQILCHQMSVIKRDPSEIGGNRGAYHFYGAVWALNLWAYEAIPDLGLACGRRLNNHSTPWIKLCYVESIVI